MSDWTDAGLPCPLSNGYSYRIDAGLLRTRQAVGYQNQERQWRTRPETFTLSFLLDAEKLQEFTAFVNAAGYSWFTMPLVTSSNGYATPIDTTVRLTSDFRVEAISPWRFRVSVNAESKDVDPICSMLARCDDFTACLRAVTFAPVDLAPQTWCSLADSWGDDAYWGNPNE